VRKKTYYSQDDIDLIRRMRAKGATLTQISDKVGKTYGSICNFIQQQGHLHGIEVAVKVKHKGGFDKEWHGVIPCGHWMITKPWGKKCDVKHVISC